MHTTFQALQLSNQFIRPRYTQIGSIEWRERPHGPEIVCEKVIHAETTGRVSSAKCGEIVYHRPVRCQLSQTLPLAMAVKQSSNSNSVGQSQTFILLVTIFGILSRPRSIFLNQRMQSVEPSGIPGSGTIEISCRRSIQSWSLLFEPQSRFWTSVMSVEPI